MSRVGVGTELLGLRSSYFSRHAGLEQPVIRACLRFAAGLWAQEHRRQVRVVISGLGNRGYAFRVSLEL